MRKKSTLFACILLAVILAPLVYRKVQFRMAGGSYPYAQRYTFNRPEQQVLDAIKQFKTQHPDYVAPLSFGLPEGRGDSSEYYDIYFYYPDKNQVAYCWTHPDGAGKTTLALVSINGGKDLHDWYVLNSGYNLWKDWKTKEDFETRVLSELRKTLK
ncbi:MAG: hypothetical protein JST82_01565 [Bacteroidetes bacterium]|nr:hypothetical protein [Bacteroidota bacterium]